MALINTVTADRDNAGIHVYPGSYTYHIASTRIVNGIGRS